MDISMTTPIVSGGMAVGPGGVGGVPLGGMGGLWPGMGGHVPISPLKIFVISTQNPNAKNFFTINDGATWSPSVGIASSAVQNYIVPVTGAHFVFQQNPIHTPNVYRTTDAGANYVYMGQTDLGAAANHRQPVILPSGRICLGNNRLLDVRVRYSDDGGAAWVNGAAVLDVPSPSGVSISVAHCPVYGVNGLVVGASGKFYSSNDGGQTFSAEIGSILTGTGYNRMWNFGNNTLLIEAGGGIFRSTDGGVTWVNVFAAPFLFASMVKLDGRLMFTRPAFPGAGQSTLYYSDDDGVTWPNSDIIAFLVGYHEQTACALGGDFYVCEGVGGRTWKGNLGSWGFWSKFSNLGVTEPVMGGK